MDIVIDVWLCREPNMMCYVLVFYGDEGETIRKNTHKILATTYIAERCWIVEIYKGAGDDLEEQEHV